jgi:hypothetical protein
MLEQCKQTTPGDDLDARLERAHEILASFEAKFGLAAPQCLSISEIAKMSAFLLGPLTGFHAASSEQKMMMALRRLVEEGPSSQGATESSGAR